MKRITVAVLASLALLVACDTSPSSPSEVSTEPSMSLPVTGSAPPVSTATSGPPVSSTPGSPSESPSGRPDATPSGTAPPSAGDSELPVPTKTKQVEVKRSPAKPPLVVKARLAAHQGYDRVVIDLQGDRTGYTVGWVKQLIEDGSGFPIEIKGGAYLQATLTPASAHTSDGKPTWGRTPMLAPELGNVRSVVRAGDFEGVVTVAIVLRHRAGFRVIEQANPTRLVIDIAH